MKRILHIIGAMDRAGAETMVMNLYRAVDRTQFQFDFLYFTDKKCDFDEEIIAFGGAIYRVSNSGLLGRSIETYKFLKENKQFHAIHSHTLLNNGFNLLAAFMAGFKIRIAHSHNTTNGIEKSISQKLYYVFSKFLINKFGTVFIACGKEAGEYLFYKNKKVIVLPNAVDFKMFTKNVKKPFLRKLLNISNECLLICQIGRLQSVKNHEFTIRLAQYMKIEAFNFHFAIIGNGVFEEQLIDLTRKLNIDDKITFLGLRSDIPEILSESDVMIMPSFYEGFPVVLVESQVAGIPAVISSTIATEVDLGIDLVNFESLDSDYKVWAEKLIAIRFSKKGGDMTYLKVLKDKGYDIHENVKELIKIYN